MRTTDPLGNSSYFTYDHNGRLTRSVDPLGHQTQSFYTKREKGTVIFSATRGPGKLCPCPAGPGLRPATSSITS